MGREIRRVPLNFDWPMNKVWEGYLNPYYRPCPKMATKECFDGATRANARLQDLVSLIMQSGMDSLSGTCHPWLGLDGLDLLNTRYQVPDKGMAELTAGLAGRPADDRLGHDAIDRWRAVRKIITAAGLDPSTWGVCPVCGGSGIDPMHKEQYEAWRRTDPPGGEGWQMWETTSEGSPISPVFASPEELARWLADTGASAFGPLHESYESWLKMIKGSGWAPSGVIDSRGEIRSGVAAAAERADSEDIG